VRYKYSCHIDIRKHYLRELCLSGIVKLIPDRGAIWVCSIVCFPCLFRMGESDYLSDDEQSVSTSGSALLGDLLQKCVRYIEIFFRQIRHVWRSSFFKA
jgi:hypothetical protein